VSAYFLGERGPERKDLKRKVSSSAEIAVEREHERNIWWALNQECKISLKRFK
jgi:hypothetical protein